MSTNFVVVRSISYARQDPESVMRLKDVTTTPPSQTTFGLHYAIEHEREDANYVEHTKNFVATSTKYRKLPPKRNV